jgi:hypothetical protein
MAHATASCDSQTQHVRGGPPRGVVSRGLLPTSPGIAPEGDRKSTMSNLVAAGSARSQDCGPAVVSPEPPQGPAPGKVARQGFRALAVVTFTC